MLKKIANDNELSGQKVIKGFPVQANKLVNAPKFSKLNNNC